MLVEIAIGDAYGAGFEFNDANLPRNDLSEYLGHALHGNVKGLWGLEPGQYTDDTQMSLAIAEALIENDPWTTESLAQRFCDVFHRDPRKGYSKRFYEFLMDHTTGIDFLADMDAYSKRCGAAMRSCPIGLLPNIREVRIYAQEQAGVTHRTREGIVSSVAVALSVHYFQYSLGSSSELWEFLRSHGLDFQPWDGSRVGVEGIPVVRAAITASLEHTSMSEVLKQAVSYGGDTDSVAAIAMGITSVSSEHDADLPQHLHDGLERGPYGYDYLASLDEKLRHV